MSINYSNVDKKYRKLNTFMNKNNARYINVGTFKQ